MSIKDLFTASVQTAEKADALSTRFARELATVLRDLERGLRPVVTEASEAAPTAIIRSARAARTRREIRDVLLQAGFDALTESAYDARLDDLIAQVLDTRRLAQQSARLNASTQQRLDALRALHETDLLDEGDSIARALWQATVRGIFGSRPVDQILIDLYDVIDATEPQIRTLYDTSVSIFTREVEALQAGDDPEAVFAYMGPADKKNREFCRAHVGKVYTREEIDAMDNGQLDNVFLTGGGFNCRHSWIEVSKFSELRDLVGTDQRIPEIQLPEAA